MPYVISEACTACGDCLPECPTGSIVVGEKQYYIDADSCADHARCVNVCPVDAISKMNMNEFIPMISRDEEEE